jgi:DNA topoisomerase-1
VAFEAWRETGGSAALDAIVGKVAEELGNTPTVSRKSYVHPAVIAAIKQHAPAPGRMPRPTRWLEPGERALIAFLHATGADWRREQTPGPQIIPAYQLHQMGTDHG